MPCIKCTGKRGFSFTIVTNTEIFFFNQKVKVNSTKLHENGAERMGGRRKGYTAPFSFVRI